MQLTILQSGGHVKPINVAIGYRCEFQARKVKMKQIAPFVMSDVKTWATNSREDSPFTDISLHQCIFITIIHVEMICLSGDDDGVAQS